MLLDYAGTLGIGATVGLLLVAVATTALTRLEHRLMLGGIAAAWAALVVAIAAKGALSNLGIFVALFVLPFVAVVALSAALPAFRSAVGRIPVPLIIALNVPRVLGVLFLFLAAAGRLGGPFPFFAGIGDIVTGLFALRVARIAATRSASDTRVLMWNAFGTLDLIVAVVLGVTSQPGSPLQLIHGGAGSAAITTAPWVEVPLFLVPFYLIGHGIVFVQARRAVASGLREIEPVRNLEPAVSTS
ncbi:MAG: hypothetical protein JO043_08165 [Candidatus Eremiobacteraeota bacterium]|nr:hypothetical protein [Candidatus Eremiobacteraeota bacterium]